MVRTLLSQRELLRWLHSRPALEITVPVRQAPHQPSSSQGLPQLETQPRLSEAVLLRLSSVPKSASLKTSTSDSEEL